jgi:hypothetical protein
VDEAAVRLLKEDPAAAKADEPAAKAKLRALAEAFCTDVNKLATTEISEWKAEFLASLTEIEKAAESGSSAAQKQLDETVKALEKATQEFQRKAEEVATKAEEAAKPAFVKVEFEGADPPATLFAHATSPAGHARTAGDRSAREKNGVEVQDSDVVDAKPGTIQALKLKLR